MAWLCSLPLTPLQLSLPCLAIKLQPLIYLVSCTNFLIDGHLHNFWFFSIYRQSWLNIHIGIIQLSNFISRPLIKGKVKGYVPSKFQEAVTNSTWFSAFTTNENCQSLQVSPKVENQCPLPYFKNSISKNLKMKHLLNYPACSSLKIWLLFHVIGSTYNGAAFDYALISDRLRQ